MRRRSRIMMKPRMSEVSERGRRGYWLSSRFRVWAKRTHVDGELGYQGQIYCKRWDRYGPILYGPMPEADWLRLAEFDEIELHYGLCGDPMEYRAEHVQFRGKDATVIDWWIEPLGARSPNDEDFVFIYVHYRVGRGMK